MFFSAEFDPIRLIGQIVLLQALFYFTYCTFLLLSHFFFSTPLHIALLLSSKAITHQSWLGTIIFLLTSATLPWFVSRIIMRTKLCLDFITSLFGFHIIIILIYDQAITRSFFFWSLYIVVIILLILASERLCMELELSEIPLDFLSANDKKPSNPKNDDKGLKKDFKPTAKTALTTPSQAAPLNSPQNGIELTTTAQYPSLHNANSINGPNSTVVATDEQFFSPNIKTGLSSRSSSFQQQPLQAASPLPSNTFGLLQPKGIYNPNNSTHSNYKLFNNNGNTSGDESDNDDDDDNERKPIRSYR